MPDDENWNAFDEAPATEVQHKEGLGDICGAEITLYHQTIFCRRVHAPGNRQHVVYVNDDSGSRTVKISWVE